MSNPLTTIFRDRLIPWAQDGLDQRLIVAGPVMKKSSVPAGVQLRKKKIPGKRVLVRTRDDGPYPIVRARWPEAGLHELFVPKLVCVLKGVTDFQAGEYVITCSEGHFILLPPGIPNVSGSHSHLEGKRLKNGYCELFQLIILRESIKCSMSYSQGAEHWSDITIGCTVPHLEAVHLFSLFYDEALEMQEESDLLCQQLLLSVFALLLRGLREGRQFKSSQDIPKSTSGEGQVSQMHDYIRMHLRQSLTIEKMARQMYMSPAQFTRFVRRETGKSFVEILTMHRIDESKYLLRNTDWSVAAIARHMGFKSANYFISFFGKNTGASPGAYRESVKLIGNSSDLTENEV